MNQHENRQPNQRNKNYQEQIEKPPKIHVDQFNSSGMMSVIDANMINLADTSQANFFNSSNKKPEMDLSLLLALESENEKVTSIEGNQKAISYSQNSNQKKR